MKSINEDHTKAIAFVQNFKNNNINTVETVKTFDPKLRCWTFQKVKIDENAKSFYDSTRPKTERKETFKQPKTTKPRKTVLNPESLRGKIYSLYKSGFSKDEISNKLDVSVRCVGSEISKRNNQLGIRQTPRKNETRLQIEKLFKKEKSLTVIAKKLGIVRSTVAYHIEKIKTSKRKDKTYES